MRSWNFPRFRGAFTVISITLIYRKWHWSVCLFLFLFRAVGQAAVGHSAVLCPFGLTRSQHSRAGGGCPVATGYFLPWSPPLSPSNCFKHSQRRGAATFNQTPKNSSGGEWGGGWVGCRPPAGSRGVMCSSLSSHNTGRETRDESRSSVFSFFQLKPQVSGFLFLFFFVF